MATDTTDPGLEARLESDCYSADSKLIAEAIVNGARLVTAAILSTSTHGQQHIQSMLRLVTNMTTPRSTKNKE